MGAMARRCLAWQLPGIWNIIKIPFCHSVPGKTFLNLDEVYWYELWDDSVMVWNCSSHSRLCWLLLLSRAPYHLSPSKIASNGGWWGRTRTGNSFCFLWNPLGCSLSSRPHFAFCGDGKTACHNPNLSHTLCEVPSPNIPCIGSCDSCSVNFGCVLLLFGEAVQGIHGFKEYTLVSSSSDENTENYYKRVLCFIYLADRRVCSKFLRTLKNK